MRSLIKTAAAAFVGAVLLAASNAAALEFKDFSVDGFAAAQSEGAPIVVDVHAVWCSTCAAQRRVIEQLAGDPRFDNVIVFVIDYDTGKNFMRLFGVRSRSTLIAFQGSEEVDRLYALTAFEAIQSLFLNAVK